MSRHEVRVARLGCSLNAWPTAAFHAEHPDASWEERWERLRCGDVRDPHPARCLRSAAAGGLRFVIPEDAEWPRRLDDLDRVLVARPTEDDRRNGRHLGTPFGLWVRGRPPSVERSVAIVGARAATDYGLGVAAELGTGLAERDVSVVSGAAFGIDAAAHRGALAVDGHTVAVLASGVDVPYPADHAVLLEHVSQVGTLISEAPPGSRPRREGFLHRNRLIAALAAGTVLVEANHRSGARNTVAHARRLGRVRMVVPGGVTSALSAGCHAELRTDLEARLVTCAAEVTEEVGDLGADLVPVPSGPEDRRDGIGAAARELLEALPPRDSWSVERIAHQVRLPLAEAFALTAALATHDLLEQTPDGFRLSALGRAPTRRHGS
ncbi:MAG: DNA-processing protein DprA [Mycobacteriales bacterium]